MDKYQQMEQWESQYRLEHPNLENGYNKADILEWLAEKVVNKNFVQPAVISSKPTSKKKKVIIDADKFSKMCDVIKRI